MGVDGVDHLQTVKTQDVEIAQDQIEATLCKGPFEICPGGDGGQMEAAVFSFQGIPHQFAVKRIVVHVENANSFAHGSSFGGDTFNAIQ